jgi:hypothetical protein
MSKVATNIHQKYFLGYYLQAVFFIKLKLDNFSGISYTTLFKIRRYQKPF